MRSKLRAARRGAGHRRSGSHWIHYVGKTQHVTRYAAPLSSPPLRTVPGPGVGSLGVARADPVGNRGGRKAGNERDQMDLAAGPLDRLPPDDVGRGIVPAFYQNVGKDLLDQAKRGLLVEEHDVVDARERGHDRRARQLALDRMSGALDRADRSVGIEPHQEVVAQAPCAAEELGVPGVDQVEAAVGEYETPAQDSSRLSPALRVLQGENFTQRAGLPRIR